MGMIMVIGVVAKNGILLLDAEAHFQDSGMSPHDAMIQAGRRRLRPIAMTALATVAGMLRSPSDSAPVRKCSSRSPSPLSAAFSAQWSFVGVYAGNPLFHAAPRGRRAKRCVNVEQALNSSIRTRYAPSRFE